MVTYILLALGVISLVFFLILRDKNGSPLATVIKTLTSLFFIATAFAALGENNTVTYDRIIVPAALIIMGLVLGLVGDITLDCKIVYQRMPKDSDTYTFAGMVSFGISHIMYITALSLLYYFNAWSLLVAVGVTVAVFAVSILAMKMNFGKWLIPSITYAFLLSLFTANAAAIAITEATVGTDLVLLLVGSILFLLSDLVLSMTYFDGKDSKIMIVSNHILYYAAQFLIAIAVLFI